MNDDPLACARGIVVATMLCVPFWVVVCVIVRWI